MLVCMSSLEFSLDPDGFGYLTVQLTDILRYSSKLIWLLCMIYLTLLCFRLIFVVTLLANIWTHNACNRKEEIFIIRSLTSNLPFIDVYLFEPVGALISTVLSQMILGSRVYSVCYLYCLVYIHLYSGFSRLSPKINSWHSSLQPL